MPEEHRIWEAIAAALAISAAVLVAGAVLQAFGFGVGGGIRYRLEFASQGANVLFALPALAAVAVIHRLGLTDDVRSTLRRWTVWIAALAALLIALGALYSIWDVLTLPIRRPTDSPALVFSGSSWASRLSVVAQRLGALTLAIVALVLAVRPNALAFRPVRQKVPWRTSEWPDPRDDGNIPEMKE